MLFRMHMRYNLFTQPTLSQSLDMTKLSRHLIGVNYEVGAGANANSTYMHTAQKVLSGL